MLLFQLESNLDRAYPLVLTGQVSPARRWRLRSAKCLEKFDARLRKMQANLVYWAALPVTSALLSDLGGYFSGIIRHITDYLCPTHRPDVYHYRSTMSAKRNEVGRRLIPVYLGP